MSIQQDIDEAKYRRVVDKVKKVIQEQGLTAQEMGVYCMNWNICMARDLPVNAETSILVAISFPLLKGYLDAVEEPRS